MQGDPFDPSDLTALVLDENHYERRITIDVLRAMGFGRVVGTAHINEAWEALCAEKPHVLLIEWLEGAQTEGLDFVRRVRTNEDSPNRAMNIFMLTARGALGDVETARKAGVDGYLRKPISAGALQKRVRRVILKPQPFVTAGSYVGPCRRRRKPDKAYGGPWRRLDDVPAMAEDEGELDVIAELARARVAMLEAATEKLTGGGADAARAVYRAAQGLIEAAEQIGDASLTLGAREMARYIQAQGATDNLDPKVVKTHVAALHQLVHLPHIMGAERERVAQALKRMVEKKLSRAASAA